MPSGFPAWRRAGYCCCELSYRLGHAKYGRKYFEDDPTVEYPEKIPDQGGEQRDQSLHWGPLERQHDPGNPGDKSHE